MEQQFPGRVPPRRESEPRHHYQPKYPDPEYRPRRHTDGTALHKMYSRPEDYRNQTQPKEMVSYICFDDESHPMECDEMDVELDLEPESKPHSKQNPLDRVDSSASRGSSNNTHESEYDGDADSEDELTLPPCYQHDIASREYDSWPKYQSTHCDQDSHSPDRHNAPLSPTRHDSDPTAQHDMSRDHDHKQQYRNACRHYHDNLRGSRGSARDHRLQNRHSSPSLSPTVSRSHDHHEPDYRRQHPLPSDSHGQGRSRAHSDQQRQSDLDEVDNDYDHYDRTPSCSPPQRHSSTGSAHGDNLIAQVAQHLAQHKDEYRSLSGDHQSGGTSNVVSELLGQVMRKMEDGGLDPNMMREVVREVQHVL